MKKTQVGQHQSVSHGGGELLFSFNDLMALAQRLITEQLADVDEEFMAGRAHGIGSLHSEILMLAKRSAMGNPQDENDADAAQTCRSRDEAQVQGGANPALPSEQPAFELPTGEQVISNVGAADLPANQPKLTPEGELAREALNVALWLYRRLPRNYGRPPHIEVPIQRLARYTGTDVADCLAECGLDPKGEQHGQ